MGYKFKRQIPHEIQEGCKANIDSPKKLPGIFEMKGIFKCVVNKQSSFLYRIKNNEIEIITLFDNRQDQSKIFKEIKEHFAYNGA